MTAWPTKIRAGRSLRGGDGSTDRGGPAVAAEPVDGGVGDRIEIPAQIMPLARPDHDLHRPDRLGYPERILVAVDHQGGHLRIQFTGPGRLRLSGWVERKREGQGAGGPEAAGGAAGDPSTRGTAAHNEREIAADLIPNGTHDCDPGLIQRRRRCR